MSTSTAVPAPQRPHLYEIDYMRNFIVAAVVANHVASQVVTTVSIGAVWTLLHVGRELFIMISAFVLVYVYGRRAMDWKTFFRRRYTLILVPYVTWTIIYSFVTTHVSSLGNALQLIGFNLLDGRAQYHLYFLLLLVQLYLIFPVLRRVLAATERYHLPILLGSGLLQLVFNQNEQFSWYVHGPLGFWLINPDPWLGSYQFFIVAGAIAAWHFEAVTRYTAAHRRGLAVAAASSLALALAVYALYVARGVPVSVASTTFQPMVVVQVLALAGLLLASAQAWLRRGAPHKRLIVTASNASFGIYLAHPLVLQGVTILAHAIDRGRIVHRIPEPLIALLVLVVVPLVIAATWLIVAALEYTPFALPLTGRFRQRRPS